MNTSSPSTSSRNCPSQKRPRPPPRTSRQSCRLLLVCFIFAQTICGGYAAAAMMNDTAVAAGCNSVRYAYSQRGLNGQDVPGAPLNADHLRVCVHGSTTCCTEKMEQQLGEHSKKEFERLLGESTHYMHSLFRTRAQKFDEFFRALLSNSKKEFHEMFKKTYGILYEQNAYVFTDLFEELENFYTNGKVRLDDLLDKFFNTLYQKMFTVLNAQYSFDEKYLVCVSEHMKELKPFGDVPKKLSVQVKRSFVATRAFAQALIHARDTVTKATQMGPVAECWRAVTRMSSCPACQGLTDVKPCNGYCVDVMKGCLGQHIMMNQQWNNFTDALIAVADRLLGPFNIEVVVEPIHIKISEAIMNFQENGNEVTQKVFNGCGKPRLGKRQANTELSFEPFSFNANEERRGGGSRQRDIGQGGASAMEKIVRDIRQKVRLTRDYWIKLPYQFCQNDRVAAGPAQEDNCWNGKAKAKYEFAIGSVDTDAIPGPTVSPSAQLNEQLYSLRFITTRLHTAYNGIDMEWYEEEDDVEPDDPLPGSGSGDYDTEDPKPSKPTERRPGKPSGGSPPIDDEDSVDDLEGSGSGMGAETTIIEDTRPRTPIREPQPPIVEQPRPTPNVPTRTTNTGGAQTKGQQMSFPRAVATYVVPAFVVWLGSLFS